jgi:hypothetical protein
MHSIIGHVSINDTSAVLTYYLTNKRKQTLGILGIVIRTSPMSVSAHIMPDAEEDVIFREKETVESKYDNDFNDGED